MTSAKRDKKGVSASELGFHLLRAVTCLILIIGCGALFDFEHGQGAIAAMGLFVLAAAVCLVRSVRLLVRHGAEPMEFTPDQVDEGAA